MRPSRHPFLSVAAGIVLVCACGPSQAQDWPTRPVTMVVPFAPGSGSDIAGRIIAARLSELLGQRIIVENVSGAGGMTGANRVAKAAPDGYQFVLGTAGSQAMNQTLYKEPLYNAAADFAPVMLAIEAPIVLIARKELPAGNLAQFIAYAKGNQARMQFGSPGAGSTPHVACILFNATAGLNVTHVPYRGAVPAMQDLIAGRIDYQCATLSPAIPNIESKAVNAIAVFSRGRSPAVPGLASAHEQGLTDFEASTWYGMFMPKGTPASIVRKLNEAAVATLDTPSVQDRLKQIGFDPVAPDRRSPEYLQKFVETEIQKWAGPIKSAGMAGQ
jgi:tripartite-type tricarboxylate transporter receptor subunit TctC